MVSRRLLIDRRLAQISAAVAVELDADGEQLALERSTGVRRFPYRVELVRLSPPFSQCHASRDALSLGEADAWVDGAEWMLRTLRGEDVCS